MLYPIIEAKEWAEKYKLPLMNTVCQKCKNTFERNIPFATKGYRGLMTKEHACGKMFISSIAVPTGESLSNLRTILYG